MNINDAIKAWLFLFTINIPVTAFASELPIRLVEDSITGGLSVINNGQCPIYKLEISTIPPAQDNLVGVMSKFNAYLFGKGSFQKTLGTLEKGETLYIDKTSILNNEGKKLGNDYVVGVWRLTGNYCGENASVSYAGASNKNTVTENTSEHFENNENIQNPTIPAEVMLTASKENNFRTPLSAASQHDEASSNELSWLSSSLYGSDNDVASLRKVSIKSFDNGYKIKIVNQFNFECDLRFRNGDPYLLSNCVSKNKPEPVCNPEMPDSMCAVSTGCFRTQNETNPSCFKSWIVEEPQVELTCSKTKTEHICKGKYTLGTTDGYTDQGVFKIVKRKK